MKYTVICSCGHERTIDIFGSASERDKKIKWYKQSAVCPDCYKRQREESIEDADKDLPKLCGTEKQVAWARKIRADLMKSNRILCFVLDGTVTANRIVADLSSRLDSGDVSEAATKDAEKVLKILTETDAKWFIENR